MLAVLQLEVSTHGPDNVVACSQSESNIAVLHSVAHALHVADFLEGAEQHSLLLGAYAVTRVHDLRLENVIGRSHVALQVRQSVREDTARTVAAAAIVLAALPLAHG